MIRVSIIGARKDRNGIGEYIGKYLRQNRAEIISVLGTTEKTSESASLSLRKYGIESHPYIDFYEMVEKEKPGAVVISSPSSTHYEYLVKCVDLGLNVFCEKPFIKPDLDDVREKVEDILKKAKEKRLTVAMNSQWPFAMKYYKKICGEVEIKKSNKFFITMSPFASGKEMIPESVPHVLSLLYFLFGKGEIGDLNVESPKEEEMVIQFRYLFGTKDCKVLIKLIRKEQQPRMLQFGWNDKVVRRSLNLKNYDIYLNYGNRKLKITDPLELSVRDFIEALEQKVEPLVGYSHILCNMSLLKQIYDGYPQLQKT
jgi:predicted dehydrogenase